MEKLRSIQTLRAVAACAVVVLHAVPSMERPIGNAGYGAAGVDLFFVISGFIMANVAAGRSAGEFLRDRLWRIYPLWWVAVLPWLFVVLRGPTFIASSLTLWPIYPDGYHVPVLKVGWTLSFELLFYLGMAIAIATRGWIVVSAYALFLFGAVIIANPLLDFLGSPMTLEFLMGVLVARLPRRPALGLLMPAGLGLLAFTSAGLGGVEASLGFQWALLRAVEWGFPVALVVWGSLSLERMFDLRLFDLPVAIGDASYSIYLFHPLAAFGLNFSWPLRLGIALGTGCAMHLLVERRLLNAKRMFTAGRAARPGGVKEA